MLEIKKVHAVWAIIVTFLSPCVAGVSAYYNSMTAIKDEFHVMRLEREREFVKKTDMKEVDLKLDRIREDLSEIKGFLKRSKQQP